MRVRVTERHIERTGKPTLRDLSEALIAIGGEGHPLLKCRMPDLDLVTAACIRFELD